MSHTFKHKQRNYYPGRDYAARPSLADLPQPLPADPDQRLVKVYVEGYEDVAFWRGIFDHFRNPYLRFEISVPTEPDLPKGKKVLMRMIPEASPELLLCMDSDFDYLFGGCTEQSRAVKQAHYLFHTYAYATENYLCYAPSLHNVCVRATKNDTRIFDFTRFMADYSRCIYPLFLWYVYSAQLAHEHIFPLASFKAAVRLNRIDITDNGAATLADLKQTVARRERLLAERNPQMVKSMQRFEQRLRERGLTPENTYLFMHGHTLMDNVVLPLLTIVCEKLRFMTLTMISMSRKEGTALKNEMANYTNQLRSIRDVLLDNENYTECPLYQRLQRDLKHYIARTIMQMRLRREIPGGEEFWTTLRRFKE